MMDLAAVKEIGKYEFDGMKARNNYGDIYF